MLLLYQRADFHQCTYTPANCPVEEIGDKTFFIAAILAAGSSAAADGVSQKAHLIAVTSSIETSNARVTVS